jgi:DUF1365 family protein
MFQSSIYRADVYHRRLQVRVHEFKTRMYTWYLDLDELPKIAARHPFLFGLNRAGLFSFHDRDHFRFLKNGATGEKKPGLSSVRQLVNDYFVSKNQPVPARVFLLTNLRLLGYGFNPVSFYFALDDQDRLYAILAEVNNTFGEQKPYLVVLDQPVHESENKRVFARAWKNFYVSPFIDRDREFVFRMKLPGEILSLGIDTYEGDKPVLRAAYSGRRKPLNRKVMLWNFFSIPLVTLKVIALIHWHALRLFLKKVPYFAKDTTDELIQKEEHKRKEVTHATI